MVIFVCFCRCKFAGCTQSFFTADRLKRHVRYSHGDKNKYFKVRAPKLETTRWRQKATQEGRVRRLAVAHRGDEQPAVKSVVSL